MILIASYIPNFFTALFLSSSQFALSDVILSWRRNFSRQRDFSWQRVFLLAARFSLGGSVFAWRLGFRSAARFSLCGRVFARGCCFLLGLGFLLSMDFGSWLLLLAARSGLYSLAILFLSPFSFTELKILLTTGLEYGLPYIILGKIFF